MNLKIYIIVVSKFLKKKTKQNIYFFPVLFAKTQRTGPIKA